MFLAQRSQLDIEESTGLIDKTKIPKLWNRYKVVQSRFELKTIKSNENLAKIHRVQIYLTKNQ